MSVSRVSQNTAPRAPRTPRAPRWNIVKTSRRWCLGFNWISRKISRKRRINEGEELTKGRNVQLPAVHVYSQRGARGAVFRDIAVSTLMITYYPGIFVPRNESSRGRMFHGTPWNIRPWERKFPGTKVPGNESYTLWNFRPQWRKYHGRKFLGTMLRNTAPAAPSAPAPNTGPGYW